MWTKEAVDELLNVLTYPYYFISYHFFGGYFSRSVKLEYMKHMDDEWAAAREFAKEDYFEDLAHELDEMIETEEWPDKEFIASPIPICTKLEPATTIYIDKEGIAFHMCNVNKCHRKYKTVIRLYDHIIKKHNHKDNK